LFGGKVVVVVVVVGFVVVLVVVVGFVVVLVVVVVGFVVVVVVVGLTVVVLVVDVLVVVVVVGFVVLVVVVSLAAGRQVVSGGVLGSSHATIIRLATVKPVLPLFILSSIAQLMLVSLVLSIVTVFSKCVVLLSVVSSIS